MIGRVLAANLGKKVGDKIELYGSEDFQVVGIYESPIVFENGGAVVLLCELQRLKNKPNEVTGFTVSRDEADRRTRICEELCQTEASNCSRA